MKVRAHYLLAKLLNCIGLLAVNRTFPFILWGSGCHHVMWVCLCCVPYPSFFWRKNMGLVEDLSNYTPTHWFCKARKHVLVDRRDHFFRTFWPKACRSSGGPFWHTFIFSRSRFSPVSSPGTLPQMCVNYLLAALLMGSLGLRFSTTVGCHTLPFILQHCHRGLWFGLNVANLHRLLLRPLFRRTCRVTV